MSSYGLYPDFLDTTDETPACRGYDTDLFFPEPGTTGSYAKAICSVCPLQDACREWALSLTSNQVHGIWGGLSDEDRRRWRRGERAGRKPRPDECDHCGTYVGNFRRIHMARSHADQAVAA